MVEQNSQASINQIPADLIYKISSFLSLDHLLVIELMNSKTREKMIGTKSAYQRILSRHVKNAYDYDDITFLKE